MPSFLVSVLFIDPYFTFKFIIFNVTLSHLRSKEFQKIHKPRIPHHRDTSKCTLVYIQMYPGKVVALLKKKATFIKIRIGWYVSVHFIEAQILIDCGNKSMFT